MSSSKQIDKAFQPLTPPKPRKWNTIRLC